VVSLEKIDTKVNIFEKQNATVQKNIREVEGASIYIRYLVVVVPLGDATPMWELQIKMVVGE
jgi:hypothetical protein